MHQARRDGNGAEDDRLGLLARARYRPLSRFVSLDVGREIP
jgi:hypothetical protein